MGSSVPSLASPMLQFFFYQSSDVLRRVDENRTVINEVTKRKAKWVGHILRRSGLILDIIEGKTDAPKKMCRRRIGALELLKRGQDYPDLKDLATDKQQWRKEYRKANVSNFPTSKFLLS